MYKLLCEYITLCEFDPNSAEMLQFKKARAATDKEKMALKSELERIKLNLKKFTNKSSPSYKLFEKSARSKMKEISKKLWKLRLFAI